MIHIGSSLMARLKKELSFIFDNKKSDIIINVSNEIAENAINNNDILQTKEESNTQSVDFYAYANNN